MGECQFCEKKISIFSNGRYPGYTLCKECSKQWNDTCRKYLLQKDDLKELFRIPRVNILSILDQKNLKYEFHDLEGDLVFLEDDVCFIGYWIKERREVGQSVKQLSRVAALGFLGERLINYVEGKNKKDEPDEAELSPAEIEIKNKYDKLQRGEDCDKMEVDLNTAVEKFPYVSVVKKKDIKLIQFQPNNSTISISTQKDSLKDASFFVLNSVPELEKSLLKKKALTHRNSHQIWNQFESKIISYLGESTSKREKKALLRGKFIELRR